jgi:hypothetical protein
MTEAELEAERLAILADEQELAEAHKRLHLTPNDLPAHAAHRVRLNDHAERVRAFKDALQQRRAAPLWPPAVEDVSRVANFCPVCESPSITPLHRNSYRCLRWGAVWIMGQRRLSEE